MEAHLRAGVALYNEGRYHAAHDAWEDEWLALPSGTPDERFLHGLIQFTAVVHHATRENWSGASGLAESAGEYLADLPGTYRAVDLTGVRPFLARAASDPTHVGRAGPPPLLYEGRAIEYEALGFEATAVVAGVIAEAEGYDEDLLDRALEEARTEVETDGAGPFAGLVFGFVRAADRRGTVFDRLRARVERLRGRDRDVEGLFEE